VFSAEVDKFRNILGVS